MPSKPDPVEHLVFTEKAVEALGEPVTVIEESRVEKVTYVQVVVAE